MCRNIFISVITLVLASIASFQAQATPVTVVGAVADNKTYNGNTTATVDFGSAVLNGVAPGDVGNVTLVTNSYTATFADKYAESGKTVTVAGLSLTGSAATNYTLVQPTLFADIEARPLTITATGVNKTYNANTNASVTLANNKISGDSISVFYGAASFADKNVGTGKAVSVSDIFIAGADADNYVLTNTTATATANITAKTLRVAATGVNKQYDGTVAATVTLSDNHIAGDSVTDSYTNAVFADPYVGDGISVSVSGISISGPDAGNYTLNSTTATAQANITPRTLNVTATGQNKNYDGTTNATVSLGDDRLSGDNITVSFSSAGFTDKNAGNGKTINVYDIVITGPDSDSYTPASSTISTTANIAAKTLTVVATGQNKVYDGSTNATVTFTDNRISGDVLTNLYTSASFSDKNVGAGKTVTVTGISLSGPDAGNYTPGNTTATTPANITQRDLTVSATGVNKAYDGTTNATVTLSDDRVAGDALTASYTTASFATAGAGTGKSVNVTGIQITGTDAPNYNLLNTTAATTANITTRSLTVNATGQNKIYDGTTNATVTLGDNRVAGDTLSASYTSAGFSDKNVGNGKTVTVSGIQVTGADAANYSLSSSNATTQANITQRDLTVSATGVNKAYDGTTNATVTLGDNRVVGDILTASYATASFATAAAGNGIAISVAGIQITGTDAGNYNLLNTTAATSANITGRALTVAATGIDKVYDGNTNATVTLSDNRLSGDSITVSYTAASFSSKTVASGKTVTVSGISVGGANAANYILATTNTTTTASITSRSLAVSATGINKVYDGTVAATVTLSDNRVAGDVFTVTYGSAAFTSSSVGNGKTVNVSSFFIAGTDAGNYSLSNNTAATTANITAASITLTLSSSSNPSGYRDNVTFTETLPADATGTVTFTTNGVAFASGAVSSGQFAGSITNLLRGTNLITAVYSGDGNYGAATNALAQVVTNHPPQTGFFSFSATNGLPLKVYISSLLTAVVDSDGDAVSLASVSVTTNGMFLPTNSIFILFRNTNFVNDRFDYVVKDNYGGSTTGQVSVASVLAPFTGQNATLIPTGGSNIVTFHGIPSFVYVVQRSVNLVTWKEISTNTAPGNGVISLNDQFTDLAGPPASAFYRLLWKPN